MSHRPLALVSGLTLGDYLLWNWSLTSGHDVLALVAGLTLLPLAVACLGLLALSLARLLARSARRSPVIAGRRDVAAQRDPQPARGAAMQPTRGAAIVSRAKEEPGTASGASSASPSRRLAA